MDLYVYKIIHYAGIMALFMAFGGLLLGALNAGGRDFLNRRLFTILHGVGMFLVLFSGFGQMARLGIVSSWPGWVLVKLAIWLILGGVISFVLRKPRYNRRMAIALLILGTVAAYLGHLKPIP